jgi:peptide/nickel transport system permease protein
MWKYIVRRSLLAVPVLFVVSVISFSIMQLAPGDPAAILMGGEYIAIATAEEIADLRTALGLDVPPIQQYFNWITGFFVGELGNSIYTGVAVATMVSDRIEATASIVLYGIFVSIMLGLPMGIIAGWKMNTWIDRSVMIFAVFGFAIPGFWLALNLIYFFCVKLGWFPVFGFRSLVTDGPLEFLRYSTLPSLTLAVAFMALIARMTRSSLVEILGEDYIRTARAKGLKESVLLRRHALKPAFMPVLTVIGLIFAAAVTGTVVTESVFAIPGMGRLFVKAVGDRDYPVIQGLMMIFATAYVFLNLIIDILYAYLDPRIRYS